MFERSKRNDDDMDQDELRSGRGQDDAHRRSTSSRDDETVDDDRDANRGNAGGTGRTRPSPSSGPTKKK